MQGQNIARDALASTHSRRAEDNNVLAENRRPGECPAAGYAKRLFSLPAVLYFLNDRSFFHSHYFRRYGRAIWGSLERSDDAVVIVIASQIVCTGRML
jgi:hypothetical protein